MLHTKIKDTKKEKIHISNAEKFIKDFKFGASIYFLGTVRNINDNKKYKYNHKKLLLDPFKKGKQINWKLNWNYLEQVEI